MKTMHLPAMLATAALLAACATPAAPPPAGPGASGSTSAVPAGGTNNATPNASAQGKIEASRGALQSGNVALAIAEAEAAVAADPGTSNTHYALGNAFNQAASTERDSTKRSDYMNKSIAAYLQAIAVNGQNADARHNLGTVYYQLRQLKEAQAQFEAALSIDPNDAKTHYMLGTIYLQDDPAQSPQSQVRAQAEFEAALKQNPQLAEAYVGLAQIHLNKGESAKALENAKRGVELSGANVHVFTYWQLAQAQCASGDKAGGQATLERVRAANEPDTDFNRQVLNLATSCR
jgi:tetratricopeptide (TPR) repeat protein